LKGTNRILDARKWIRGRVRDLAKAHSDLAGNQDRSTLGPRQPSQAGGPSKAAFHKSTICVARPKSDATPRPPLPNFIPVRCVLPHAPFVPTAGDSRNLVNVWMKTVQEIPIGIYHEATELHQIPVLPSSDSMDQT